MCATAPECCDEDGEWDQSCADRAWQLCPGLDGCQPPPDPVCGDAGTGDCCFANGTPFCNDGNCCHAVCDIDPYCCDLDDGEWDACCAELATDICEHPLGPGDLCVCGPGSGPCREANGTPGCDNPECCAAVCETDPFCCAQEWDAMCAELACEHVGPCLDCDCPSIHCDPLFVSCEGVCGEIPWGGCMCDEDCMANGNCCADICEHCPSTPSCNPADLTGDNLVGVPDVLVLLGEWGDCTLPPPEEHCPDPIPCPADFTSNGAVGVADLLFMLNNWGGEGQPDPNSCAGACGGYGGFCWCDELCCEFGDCCDDKVEQCGGCRP